MSFHYSDTSNEVEAYSIPNIEVFHADQGDLTDPETNEPLAAGFYWWPCFPGCLPDGDATGPFQSAAQALVHARAFLRGD